MLIASMNPCPCGYFNHPTKDCVCPVPVRQRYLNKISGPLLDRIDIHIEITPVPFDDLANQPDAESSERIRQRVIKAREIQQERFEDTEIYANSQMSSRLLRRHVEIDEAGKKILKTATDRLGLSARAYDRILKVARTIADLDNSEKVQTHHLAEAINYRTLDRDNWAG
jgi:magnesium chelatase family protein